MPAGHLGAKRMGELAELAFMYRAASEGIGVARPYGDSHPYDFLVQHGRRLLRIQVKSCFNLPRGHRYRGFPIATTKHGHRGKLIYSPDEIDFIAAFVAPHQVWYLIPVESLASSQAIRLYPGGHGPRSAAFYEDYREAWCLLKDEKNAEIPHPQTNADSGTEKPAGDEEKILCRKQKNVRAKSITGMGQLTTEDHPAKDHQAKDHQAKN
jgi:PD-(D/E)XK endonuclease